MPDRLAAPDYGIDAPGLRTGMASVGVLSLLGLVGVAFVWPMTMAPAARIAVIVLTGVAAAYGLGMSAYMTWGSRVGKLRTRDRLLEIVAARRGWSGRENVLDVGCGRGLMAIGAAKRLTDGLAIGIDLWRAEDQSGNTPRAFLDNAAREGVEGRVRVETGDARQLALTDGSMDVVLSHWVLHNIEDEGDRRRALREIWRVLKPGGFVAIADIAHVAAYARELEAIGAQVVERDDGGIAARLNGLLSGGTFRPEFIVAGKREV